ncbi:MAG: YdcF family protein, partial [Planctomycetes bacterium]|nr:YdcF family protein [Planctomycetota bacterium]
MAILDGVRYFLGVLLIADAWRSLATPEASLLALLVRLPAGVPLPAIDGFFLGAALLFVHPLSALVIAGHALLAAANIVEFYALRAEGLAAAALPFSLATLTLFAASAARVFYEGPRARWPWLGVGAAGAGPALLILHLFSFGATDYARPAQAIVVFGARVYRDGTPSLALGDRVKHGVRLYHAGVAPALVLSGAPEEVAAMKRLAQDRGVPAAALVLDPAGLNSFATLA